MGGCLGAGRSGLPDIQIEGYLPYGVFRARQRQDNKTKVEPVDSYDVFHTRHVGPGVKGILGMHR